MSVCTYITVCVCLPVSACLVSFIPYLEVCLSTRVPLSTHQPMQTPTSPSDEHRLSGDVLGDDGGGDEDHDDGLQPVVDDTTQQQQQLRNCLQHVRHPHAPDVQLLRGTFQTNSDTGNELIIFFYFFLRRRKSETERGPEHLAEPTHKGVNRRFPEITGKDNLTVFSYSGRVKSPKWRRQLRRADLQQF